MYYSYDTCAGANRNIDEDAFAFYLMENFGIGRSAPLRAVIPWSLPPMHFKRDPSSGRPHEGLDDLYEDDRIPWHGIYVDYFDTMLDAGHAGAQAGIELSFVSGGSRRTTESAWTAAVKDVARGVADVAISDFWMTVERSNLVGFSTPVRMDSLHLWVARPTREAEAPCSSTKCNTLADTHPTPL